MSVLSKITTSLSNLSEASLSRASYYKEHCARCGRETRWVVHLARGYFRCTECGATPDHRRDG